MNLYYPIYQLFSLIFAHKTQWNIIKYNFTITLFWIEILRKNNRIYSNIYNYVLEDQVIYTENTVEVLSSAFHTLLNPINKTCKCMQTSIIQNTKETLSKNKKIFIYAFFLPS